VSIILPPSSASFVDSFKNSPSQALLLQGQPGVGLKTFALKLVEEAGMLHRVIEPIAKTARARAIIDVDTIRELYADTRTKFDSPHFVVIDDADRMNPAAQNALLKLLEEPNPSVHFVLTTHAPELLVPTIRSRVWKFSVTEIDDMASRRLLKSKGVTDESRIAQLLYVASGLPAELSRLCASEKDFEKLAFSVRTARSFVEGSSYDRIVIANSFKEDREAALKFIDTSILLLRRTVKTSREPKQKLTLINQLLEAHELIRANGNIRLQLAAAVL
jgi:hypothetical protein